MLEGLVRDENDYKLNNFYESCLGKVLAYKPIAFCCGTIVIPRFDLREAAKRALATVRLWLASNYSSVNCAIFCANENADYEIYKDLNAFWLMLMWNKAQILIVL